MSTAEFKVKADRIQSQLERGSIVCAKDAWTMLFDNWTDAGLKSEIAAALRSGIKDSVARPSSGAAHADYGIRGLGSLSEDTLTAIVMSGGYEMSRYFYPCLKEAGISSNFVMIGYSSGATNHTRAKLFSDGTEMTGKIFVLEEDLHALMESSNVLFIDDYIETRVTLTAIGDALIRMGYSGKMNEMDFSGHVRDWSYKLLVPDIELPSRDRMVMTENGIALKETERK